MLVWNYKRKLIGYILIRREQHWKYFRKHLQNLNNERKQPVTKSIQRETMYVERVHKACPHVYNQKLFF